VCPPNHPPGPAVTEAQMREFLTKIPENVVVVIDEAYYEFCTASTVPAGQNAPVNGLNLLNDHPNVIVLRTFSKAQGLAGPRGGEPSGAVVVGDALSANADKS